MKRITIAALLWVCSSAFAQSVVVLDERSFPIGAGETQSTIVRPGHPQCAGGRVLVSNDWVRPHATKGIVVYRDLNEPATAMHESTFDVMPDKDDYQFGTNDHDLVSLPNGDVLYMSGAFSKTKVAPEPAWWKSAYRWSFGPGARSVLLVWRSTDCGKTFQYQSNMAFDPAVVSDGSCALPQRPRTFRHDSTGSANLVVPFAAFTAAGGDEEWTWCFKCQQLFSTRSGQPRICPGGGEHATGGAYELHQGVILGHPDDAGFKRCKHCGTLFDSEGAASKCAARTGHDAGTKDYFLIHGATPAAGATQLEQGWRWCSKCQTLYLEGATPSACPAGMRHDGSSSASYQIPLKSSTFTGEQGWRRCSKCQQLFRDTQGMSNVCLKGNGHTSTGASLQLSESAPPNVTSQAGWRQCTKCGSLHITGADNVSQCPLVGSHDGTGSPDYHLPHEEGTGSLTNMQTQWRSCARCGSVYFSGHPSQTCAARQKGTEQPFYDMGGSDGQLVNVDRATGQIYLAFQCVGFTAEPSQAHFELSNTRLNRTLVAVSSGASWSVLGTPKTRSWRMGLLPQGAAKLALSVGGVLIPATANSFGKWTFGSTGIDVAKAHSGWDGFDSKKTPRNLIHTNIWNHTVIARTPGSKRVLMTVPDTFAGKGHGYRLFFVDPDTSAVTEAKVPVLPASANPDDFILHVQAIDIGTGPVLLYWNDVSGSDVTIRGRFVTGLDKYTKDFVISRAGGKDRSFSLKQVTSAYWYGDYQTAGGYKVDGVIGRSHYYPLWVEPDKSVHYGHVVYNPLGLVPASPTMTKTAAGLSKIAKRVPVTSIKADEESEEYEERSRVQQQPRPERPPNPQ
jgi:hypothetical protein